MNARHPCAGFSGPLLPRHQPRHYTGPFPPTIPSSCSNRSPHACAASPFLPEESPALPADLRQARRGLFCTAGLTERLMYDSSEAARTRRFISPIACRESSSRTKPLPITCWPGGTKIASVPEIGSCIIVRFAIMDEPCIPFHFDKIVRFPGREKAGAGCQQEGTKGREKKNTVAHGSPYGLSTGRRQDTTGKSNAIPRFVPT